MPQQPDSPVTLSEVLVAEKSIKPYSAHASAVRDDPRPDKSIGGITEANCGVILVAARMALLVGYVCGSPSTTLQCLPSLISRRCPLTVRIATTTIHGINYAS